MATIFPQYFLLFDQFSVYKQLPITTSSLNSSSLLTTPMLQHLCKTACYVEALNLLGLVLVPLPGCPPHSIQAPIVYIELPLLLVHFHYATKQVLTSCTGLLPPPPAPPFPILGPSWIPFTSWLGRTPCSGPVQLPLCCP